MVNQIQKFQANAIAIELIEPFTEADALSIIQLFEEKISEGHSHVNVLIKVKDMSLLKHTQAKGFVKGEWWGLRNFSKIGRCAIVSHSSALKTIVNIESKIIRIFNSSLEEKYFDNSQIQEALDFVNPDK